MVGASYKPNLSFESSQSRRFLDIGLKTSSDGVKAGSGNLTLTDFLVCSLNVFDNLSEWLHSNKPEDCPYMSCCVDFSVVYIKLSNFSLHSFGKRAVLVLSDSKSRRVVEKLETLIWRVVPKYWRKLEEFRVQSSLQVENKPQRQLIALESDIHRGVLLKCNET